MNIETRADANPGYTRSLVTTRGPDRGGPARTRACCTHPTNAPLTIVATISPMLYRRYDWLAPRHVKTIATTICVSLGPTRARKNRTTCETSWFKRGTIRSDGCQVSCYSRPSLASSQALAEGNPPTEAPPREDRDWFHAQPVPSNSQQTRLPAKRYLAH